MIIIYQLKPDGVEVHHVRHRTSLRNVDVCHVDGTAQLVRNQVSVQPVSYTHLTLPTNREV